MNRWKLISAVLLFTTLLSSYLAFDFSRADDVDEFSVAAAESIIKELPFMLEDVAISYESYHNQDSGEAGAQMKTALLTKSLQRLTGNQRLLNTAERSALLEKGWFNEYNNALFTLNGIITHHSFEQETDADNKALASSLRTLKEEIKTLVNDPSFSIQNPSQLDKLTTTIQQFNENY